MTDTKTYVQKAEEFNPLKESIVRSAIKSLQFPLGSKGLDAGCGIGCQALLLAEEVGPSGHVTGLDLSPEFLLYAERIVEKSCLSQRITFMEGNVNHLPFENNTFDWIWSADCAGYPTAENHGALVSDLVRVIKPGGKLAILAYTSQQLLPGYGLLEARLNATCSAYLPYLRNTKPQHNFLRALGWFHEAGLEDITVHTFVKDVYAPLSDMNRTALNSLIFMLWGEKQPDVSEQDWEEFQRLCQPHSPDYLLNLQDYYAFFTYTMFSGRVPK